MNRIYQSAWNDKTGTFVAVSEINTSAGRKSSPGTSARTGTVAENARFALKALAISVMVAFGANAYALPVGGVVAQGGASISNAPGSTTITQSSQNVAINWQSFSIGATEAVRFVQPNSSSVALNRVLGPDPSSILGSMSANGKVFLLNPNGILFGHGSQVNVGGLVASTLNMTDSDFMAGNYRFSGSSDAAVVNQGTINAPGGYVALLGANVANDGTILARLGTVALAAGNAMTLDVAGDGLLNVTVSAGAVNALARNGGLIQADGGNVLLTAMAAGMLLQSAVNNTGVIQAQTIENHNGTIRLMGDMRIGTTNVGGTLDASAPNGGDGGFIEASAARVLFASDARITTAAPDGLYGTFLIDPQDFTVGSAPGNNITGAALSGLLVTNSVIISTDIGIDSVAVAVPPVSSLFSPLLGNGDIFITEAVVWVTGARTTLTLNAARDVNIGRNSAGLILPAAAISTTGGNLVVCCGRDINVDAALTTAGAGGSILLNAGNNVNVNAAISLTLGNLTVCAGNNVNLMGVAAAITLVNIPAIPALTLGLADGLVLSGGTNGTGAGTVIFAPGTPPAAITNAPVNIYYNPVNYTTPTDYSTGVFFTLVGALSTVTEFMLVFPDGANKTFDGTTVATFTGLKGAPAGVTLNPGGIANFDTAAVGANKTVSFTGVGITQVAPILPGGVAINYALATSCCGPVVGKTTATIIAAPPVIPPAPPVVPILPTEAEIFAPEEMMGPDAFMAVATVLPNLMPRIELAGLPPQLLSIAPVRVPVVVPPPPPVIQEAPIYVPPVRPLKQDRN